LTTHTSSVREPSDEAVSVIESALRDVPRRVHTLGAPEPPEPPSAEDFPRNQERQIGLSGVGDGYYLV
jgi:hypothetical protein